MALWKQFSPLLSFQTNPDIETGTACLPSVYNLCKSQEDALLIYTRAGFPEWIETSLRIISPINFVRGLQYLLKYALHMSKEHQACRISLIKYLRLLYNLKTPSDCKRFYQRLFDCLKEELKVVRLQNKEAAIVTDVAFAAYLEASDFPLTIRVEQNNSNMDQCKFNINELWKQLQNLGNDLRTTDERLNSLIHHIPAVYRQWVTEHQINDNHPLSIIESARNILKEKTNLHQVIRNISESTSRILSEFRLCVQIYDRFHVFGSRSKQIDSNGIESIGKLVGAVIGLLENVRSCAKRHSGIESCKEAFQIIYNVATSMPNLSCSSEPELTNVTSYQSHLAQHVGDLSQQILSMYQTFTLVMDRHPPMVMMKGSSSKLVSFRVFNFNNILNGSIKIFVRLVNEHTIRYIRTNNSIPTIPDKASSGTIVVTDATVKGDATDVPEKRKRARKDMTQPTGKSVVVFETQIEPNDSCILVEKEIQVTARITNKSDNAKKPDVTSEKFALLFVMEIPWENEWKQVWTISLPMTLTAHASQNDKAWSTIAWDEAFAQHDRQGFETDSCANWPRILQMLQGTFDVLVGGTLESSHLLYLQKKAQDLIPNFPHNISKANLTTNEKNSFWKWFFKSMTVVNKTSHFHDAWKNGYIEGFIGYEEALALLTSSRVDPGTFIFRFSDEDPGNLTLVFLAQNGEVYKIRAIEATKQNVSLEAYSQALLDKLNLKETRHGTEIFVKVYPDICKKIAFKKFYDKAPKSTSGKKDPYLTVESLVPLPPASSAGPETENIGAIEPSSGSGNKTQVSTPLPEYEPLPLDDRFLSSIEIPVDYEDDEFPSLMDIDDIEIGFDVAAGIVTEASFLNSLLGQQSSSAPFLRIPQTSEIQNPATSNSSFTF